LSPQQRIEPELAKEHVKYMPATSCFATLRAASFDGASARSAELGATGASATVSDARPTRIARFTNIENEFTHKSSVVNGGDR
jgi:hypothetical protein